MNTPQYIPSFYFYKFAQGISAPYTELAAYSAGAIDSSGNILKAESSIDSFEYLIIKLKKIFEQLPAGLTKAQLTNYLSTLQLFSEAVQAYDISDAQFAGLVEGYIALNKNPNTSYIALCEDMGVGGGGGGAGTIGTPVVSNNQGGVGGFDPVMAPMQRRKPPVGLDNCEMFDVCPEEMGQFKLAKAWKHLPASETKTYLQRYQARNPKGKIALRSVDPDTGKQDIHWVDYSKQSFAEEFKLNFLDILNESLVKDYTDSAKDDEINVATRTNDREIKPLEISGKELQTTAEIVRQKYEDEKQKEDEKKKQPYLKAGSAEKYAAGTELEKSIPTALELMKRLGNQGAEIAQRWHGQFRHSAEKPISTHEPDYYGLGNLEGLEDLENPEDLIKVFDAKNIKARGQVNIDPSEFFKDTQVGGLKGFPTVSGTPAHIARELATEAGDTSEAERIKSKILDPFYSDPGAQEQLRTHYMSQTFPQNDKMSLRLATKKGRELIPIGVADAETILRKGISVRTTRGGKQPVEKSQLGIKSRSDFGIIAVGKDNPLQTLPREDQSNLERLSPELKRFSSWLRTT
jgi:hypothetical protein